jgi:hypothetical protein
MTSFKDWLDERNISPEDAAEMKDWAIQTLDDVAADSTGSGEAPNPLQSLPRAAEDGAAYIAKKKDAAG